MHSYIQGLVHVGLVLVIVALVWCWVAVWCHQRFKLIIQVHLENSLQLLANFVTGIWIMNRHSKWEQAAFAWWENDRCLGGGLSYLLHWRLLKPCLCNKSVSFCQLQHCRFSPFPVPCEDRGTSSLQNIVVCEKWPKFSWWLS
jgi:hypothetical protein